MTPSANLLLRRIYHQRRSSGRQHNLYRADFAAITRHERADGWTAQTALALRTNGGFACPARINARARQAFGHASSLVLCLHSLLSYGDLCVTLPWTWWTTCLIRNSSSGRGQRLPHPGPPSQPGSMTTGILVTHLAPPATFHSPILYSSCTCAPLNMTHVFFFPCCPFCIFSSPPLRALKPPLHTLPCPATLLPHLCGCTLPACLVKHAF